MFSSYTGNVAKSLRMALGSLIIQIKYNFSDKELIFQLIENPYYQYFIGLPSYQKETPFDSSTLVLFRKRITAEMMIEANECLIRDNSSKDGGDDDNNDPKSGSNNQCDSYTPKNKGTLIVNATFSPSNIRYPIDFSLLNEARKKLEQILDRYCKDYNLLKPKMYKTEARKNYLALAKSKKRSKSKIKKTIRKQLGYVKRNLGYLYKFMSEGYAPTSKKSLYLKQYEQQEYMYTNKTHKFDN